MRIARIIANDAMTTKSQMLWAKKAASVSVNQRLRRRLKSSRVLAADEIGVLPK